MPLASTEKRKTANWTFLPQYEARFNENLRTFGPVDGQAGDRTNLASMPPAQRSRRFRSCKHDKKTCGVFAALLFATVVFVIVICALSARDRGDSSVVQGSAVTVGLESGTSTLPATLSLSYRTSQHSHASTTGSSARESKLSSSPTSDALAAGTTVVTSVLTSTDVVSTTSDETSTDVVSTTRDEKATLTSVVSATTIMTSTAVRTSEVQATQTISAFETPTSMVHSTSTTLETSSETQVPEMTVQSTLTKRPSATKTTLRSANVITTLTGWLGRCGAPGTPC